MPGTDTEPPGEGEAAMRVPNTAQHDDEASLRANIKDQYEEEALISALDKKNFGLVKSLLDESIPKDRRNAYLAKRARFHSRTALHVAAAILTTECEDYNLIDLLLENAADKNECVTARDSAGFTALHMAAMRADVEVVRRLVDGATDKIGYINVKTNNRITPLQCLAVPRHPAGDINEHRNIDSVLFLLSQGANADLTDDYGESAWDTACRPLEENWDIIPIFILVELDAWHLFAEGQLEERLRANKVIYSWPELLIGGRTTGNNMLRVYYYLFIIVGRLLKQKYSDEHESESTEAIHKPSYPEIVKACSSLFRQIRQEFQENQEAPPRLRSRQPSCTVQPLNCPVPVNSGAKRFVSIVMPFIDVKKWAIIKEREDEFERYKLKYCISNTGRFIEYHMPTTLDEYCNPALSGEALSLRNKDQVLKRYEEFVRGKNYDTQADNDIVSTSSSDNSQDDLTLLGELKILLRSYMKCQKATETTAEEVPPPENVVLVRQSWIWIIDNNIITTQPLERDPKNLFFKRREIERDDPRPAESVALTLGMLIEHLDNPALAGEGSLLKIYENALLFISEEVNEYTKSALVEDIDLDRENAIFHKINDLREELSMIRSVLAEQEEVWNEFMSLMWPNQGPDQQPKSYRKAEYTGNLVPESAEERSAETNEEVVESERFRQIWRPRAKFNKYKRRIEKLEQDAERVERNILTKLDLKQKHATIKEAHSTAVLSATVFGFTIITVIFAPLSFVIALFALPIDMFNEGKNGDKDGVYSYHYIGKWTAATELVSIFVTLLAMWAALRFTGLHVWGKKGLRETIRQKAKDIRTAERKAEEASKGKARTSDVERGMSTTYSSSERATNDTGQRSVSWVSESPSS
ncbi:hypothetical protein GGR51DRAFT_556457 [Nemania sp. FL0031]|nr:hypothetical protein GGR51DRAFT_556457 [Nemania sp. FL0031]